MQLELRAATSEDHAFLHALNRLAYEEVVTRQFGLWDEDAQRQRFDAKLQRTAFRIVELAGRPIAAVWAAEQADHIWLHELLVLPDVQNRGIGSQVLRAELARAAAAGKPMRLHTLVLNRAQAFFIRHGFVETGRTDVYVDMERAANEPLPPMGAGDG
jgi:GNAT superfamily N-acetyltransferase